MKVCEIDSQRVRSAAGQLMHVLKPEPVLSRGVAKPGFVLGPVEREVCRTVLTVQDSSPPEGVGKIIYLVCLLQLTRRNYS